MSYLPKHEWQTINRERVSPEDLGVAEVIEEIRCALMAMPEAEFLLLAKALDAGKYDAVGEYVADGFVRMDEE